MYTLRTFKERGEINRLQINLGNAYQVKQDPEKGIKYRVFCDNPLAPDGGYAIFNDEYAFIMSNNGETFETLNKPIPRISDNGEPSLKCDEEIRPMVIQPKNSIVDMLNEMKFGRPAHIQKKIEACIDYMKNDSLLEFDKKENESFSDIQKLNMVTDMCKESLEPALFERWEDIVKALKQVRKEFKA
jgi:hypothetical protein